jgi:hypothetical protein
MGELEIGQMLHEELATGSEKYKRLTHPIVLILTLDTRKDALSWVWRVL